MQPKHYSWKLGWLQLADIRHPYQYYGDDSDTTVDHWRPLDNQFSYEMETGSERVGRFIATNLFTGAIAQLNSIRGAVVS